MRVAVAVESGQKRVFASALDWPGWSRGDRDEARALEALAAAAPRYAVAAAEAGVAFPAGGSAPAFEVVERLRGGVSTDFGVPHEIAEADRRPLDARGARRQAALVAACWTVLDRVAASSPKELRKGPRGGGRDRDKIVDHVLGAEASYARKIGVRLRQPERDDAAAVAELRTAILGVLGAPNPGQPVVERGWPVRYAARRIAWHVLDHAWEIENRRPEP
jgi:hypothetical protein